MKKIDGNMKKERKIYVVGGSKSYANWMEPSFITNDITNADLVLFTGGEDVTPALYGESENPRTGNNLDRDMKELEEFKKAKELGLPLIGICRGSQFACVLAGGKLVQHQQNPLYLHPIKLINGEEIIITSTHHQAQYPYLLPEDNYKLIGWTNGISKMHEGGNEEEMSLPDGKEAEIVYYPKIKALAIQGHPESLFQDYGTRPSVNKTIDYLRGLLDDLMENKL